MFREKLVSVDNGKMLGGISHVLLDALPASVVLMWRIHMSKG